MPNLVLCHLLRTTGNDALNQNKYFSRSGKNHWNYKGGRTKIGKYWYIKIPDHPFAHSSGYYPEHRLVYEKYYNCILFPFPIVVVHHIDGNKENNEISNLQPLYRGQHMSLENTKDMSNRYCLLCSSTETYKINRIYKIWLIYNDGFICHKCYYKIYHINFYKKRK